MSLATGPRAGYYLDRLHPAQSTFTPPSAA